MSDQQKKTYKLRSSNTIVFNGNFLGFQITENNGYKFMSAQFLVNNNVITVKVHQSQFETIESLKESQAVSVFNAIFSQNSKISKTTGKTYFTTDVYLNKNCLIGTTPDSFTSNNSGSFSSVNFIGTFMSKGSKEFGESIVLVASFEINKARFNKDENKYINESSTLVTYFDVAQDTAISKIRPGDSVCVFNATLESQARNNNNGDTFNVNIIRITDKSTLTVINRPSSYINDEKKFENIDLQEQSLVESLNFDSNHDINLDKSIFNQ